jgi:hypothetical protein
MRSAADILDSMDTRQARYQALLQTMEWRAYAHRAKTRAGFACQVCRRGGPGVELNVHHHAYTSDRLPWEYAWNEVSVLCGGPGGCHGLLHRELQAFRLYVFGFLTPRAFQVLNGALAVAMGHYDPLLVAYAVANLVASPESVKRFGEGWKG